MTGPKPLGEVGEAAIAKHTSRASAIPSGADQLLRPRADSSLPGFLRSLPGVDQVGLEARAAALATRSIKAGAKILALETAISMVDLTTLEGDDTPGKVRALCAKAKAPDPADPGVGPVAAVCIYPDLVSLAKAELANSPVLVAAVATAFPSGRSPLSVKLADVEAAVEAGADEVDMVIDRAALLAGDYARVLLEVREVKKACGGAHLKVILETGELATYDNINRASWIAMLGGADFIKTSTGKVAPASTLPVALLMMEAVREYHGETGRPVGVKVAGGIRTAKDAIRYLVLVNETLPGQWMSKSLFRFGASSLLNDLLVQRYKQIHGVYGGPDDYSLE